MGASIIPRQPARWVVLDQLGGGKQNGQPYLDRQRAIVGFYVGIVVSR
jgi:hypothetical protein